MKIGKGLQFKEWIVATLGLLFIHIPSYEH